MTSLDALQHDFQDYLLGKSKAFEQAITGPNAAFAKQRLAIYSDAYQLRLVDILKIDFPCLYQWLGPKAFNKLGLAYLERYPSTFFSAREFGRYMASYLAATKPYNSNTFLSEFATFERTLSETIDSPNASIVTLQDVATIAPESWPNLRFILHPTATLLSLNWNIPAIHSALTVDNLKISRKRTQQTSFWMVWRHHIEVRYKPLAQQETYIIQACSQGLPFEHICQGLTEWLPDQDAALYIVQFLQRWIPEQIFTRITVD